MSSNFSKKTINCNGKLVNFSIPAIMGIVNITPDSFYKDSRFQTEKEIIERIEIIQKEGGTFVDVGAYSSRPGALHISENEEFERLKFALTIINKNFKDLIISVDTFRAETAKRIVLDYGVSIINDISAGEMDKNMFQTIAELNVPYIMMHMKGTPENMQDNPEYFDLMNEIMIYFAEKINKLKFLGVKDIIIDPGFGFGKTIEDNYHILNNLEKFQVFDLPVLVGLSRKSMIYKLLEINPEESLSGTIALNMIALQKKCNILRVHDVKEAAEIIKIFNFLKNNTNDIS